MYDVCMEEECSDAFVRVYVRMQQLLKQSLYKLVISFICI